MEKYDRQHPFLASIKERYLLSKQGSKKNTLHIVLDIKGSGITYKVGDSVGIYPWHDSDLVEKTLHAFKMDGQEQAFHQASEKLTSLRSFFTHKANLTDISPKLYREVLSRQTDKDKKHFLSTLLEESQREHYKAFIEKHEVWDFLLSNEEVSFSPDEIVTLLMPLLPRFYSISSSQRYVGEEIHLTIAPLEYESNGHKRRGVCTHTITHLVELHQPVIPVFIQHSHGFNLPEDPHSPALIMIGPGTGIAPFRGFLQERLLHHQSKAKHWLFFGEWNRAYDFFYEDDWNHYRQWGDLKLDVAFSRDQEEKVYVQDKMWEKGDEFFKWLEEGAIVYVCGDAQKMAKDVEKTLLKIIQEYGRKEEGDAREYLKKLRQQKRYLRDVY